MNFIALTQLPKRLFAWGLAKANTADQTSIKLSNCREHSSLADLKRSLLGQIQGTVLEIGPGAGSNFAYYPTDIHWIGVEPNPFMSSYLHQEATQRGIQSIELYEGAAENLPVEADSADVVVSSHVLCSVSNLDQALQEVQRVLKPGGQFIFLEHVAAESCTWTRRIQEGVAPLWKSLFDNCHLNRETWQALEAAGFATLDYHHFQIPLPLVSPHIAGIATMP
ncbi:Methyltransferase type 11 [Halothece sp. PCC 7418]|uniref:class I SAM-dependent methyltransferase n=1 Tax=Halothece sp. (strain PCC 7418) TaxID=65093 RepID=UPI0002A0889E|nr:class I SAM-dependent methyltransferase [Halothece sp. PCC 7418]AFZ43522.1 Methyltransferase type 11 [Halothece sp. PCC 7418]